ncbi:MAG: hypothetical protein N4P92_01605, partial [Candidatus Lightella neohaematopini]|nr:hypothetical protein [Candidatus Lightella neohaematopini]
VYQFHHLGKNKNILIKITTINIIYLLKFFFKHLRCFDDCQILSLFSIFLVKLANNKLNKKNNIASIIVNLIMVFPVLIELDNILDILCVLNVNPSYFLFCNIITIIKIADTNKNIIINILYIFST